MTSHQVAQAGLFRELRRWGEKITKRKTPLLGRLSVAGRDSAVEA